MRSLQEMVEDGAVGGFQRVCAGNLNQLGSLGEATDVRNL